MIDQKVVSTGDSSVFYVGLQAISTDIHNTRYIAGSQKDEIDGWNEGILYKLADDNQLLWEKSFGGANYDVFDALVFIQEKYLLLAGASFSFGDPNWGNTYVVKTDTTGELIWQKSIGQNNFPERAYGIDTTAGGGVVLAGIQGFEPQQNLFVMRLDSNGNQLWKKVIGGPYDDSNFPRISTLRNGDFLLTSAIRPTALTKNALMVRLDSTGNTRWQREYPNGDGEAWFTFSTELPNGSLVMGGGNATFDSLSQNYWPRGTLSKTDSLGNLLWHREYLTRPDRSNYLFTMIPTSDGGFLMGGFAYRENNNRQDAWAVKVDSLGCLEPGCATVDINARPEFSLNLIIRPNPTAGWFVVQTPDEDLLGVQLFDAAGRRLEDVQFVRGYGARQYSLSLAGQPPGLYFLALRTTRGWAVEEIVKH